MKVLNALLCDEVRREDNGKLLIIGVYTADIGVQRFPVNLSLSLWIGFSPPERHKIDMSIRVREKMRRRTPIFSGNGIITVDDPSQNVYVTFPKLLVSVEDKTTLVFEIREEGKRWRKIMEMPVRLGQ